MGQAENNEALGMSWLDVKDTGAKVRCCEWDIPDFGFIKHSTHTSNPTTFQGWDLLEGIGGCVSPPIALARNGIMPPLTVFSMAAALSTTMLTGLRIHFTRLLFPLVSAIPQERLEE